MYNPETQTTPGTRYRTKTNKAKTQHRKIKKLSNTDDHRLTKTRERGCETRCW